MHRFSILVIIIQLQFVSITFCQSIDSLNSIHQSLPEGSTRLGLTLLLGQLYQNERAYAKAIDYYQAYNSRVSDEKKMLPVLQSMASCYNALKNINHELLLRRQITRIYEQQKDTVHLLKALRDMAQLSVNNDQRDSAIVYNEKIIQFSAGNPVSMINAYNDLGVLYRQKNNNEIAAEYFDKSQSLLSDKSLALINDDNRVALLMNLSVEYLHQGNVSAANESLQQALAIRQAQPNLVGRAEVLNYIAALDFLTGNKQESADKVLEAIRLATRDTAEARKQRAKNVLLDSYKLMSEIQLSNNEIGEFKKYILLRATLQQEMIVEERKELQLLLENQLEIEKKESERRELQAKVAINELNLRQSSLEKQQQQDELALKSKEVLLLQQQNEIDKVNLKNQQLHNDQIAQMLKLVQKQAEADSKQAQIVLIEKEKTVQDLQLERSNQAIDLLERAKATADKVQFFGSILTISLILLSILSIYSFFTIKRKNRLLLKQTNDIALKQEEVVAQNEELFQKSEEMAAQNESISSQKKIIEEQNTLLLNSKASLENKVLERTFELKVSNEELEKQNTQLEQFSYMTAHNLRGPVARLMGLTSIISLQDSERNNPELLMGIKKSSNDLDEIIRDISSILQVRKGVQNQFQVLDVKQFLEKVLTSLKTDCEEQQITVSLNENLKGTILGIEPYVNSVFYNVLSNAIKYADDRNSRSVIIWMDSTPELRTIHFQDNGVGFNSELLKDKMYKPFTRLTEKKEGKGLGLYLMKIQVEAMGGSIRIESKENKGTLVSISFVSGSQSKRA